METVKIKLTDAVLQKIDPSIKRINDADIPGFHVRIGAANKEGTPTIKFYFYFRFGGSGGTQHNYFIGKHSDLTAKQARTEAKTLSGRVASGENVQLSKTNTMQAYRDEKQAPDVNSLLDDYIRLSANNNLKRPDELVRNFDTDVRPTIGKIKLHTIDKKTVINLCLDPIKERGAPVQANKILSVLKTTFQWGVERGELEINPLQGTNKKSIGGIEKSRDRFLTTKEIYFFFNWLLKSSASLQVKHCFKLLLLTGCRAEEMTLAKWTHIDFEKRMWLFPKENRKGQKDTTKDHWVPLTDLMIESLDNLRSAFALIGSDFVFTTTSGAIGEKAIDRSACAKFLRRRFAGEKPELDMIKFVPHDLRRTVRTHLSRLGVEAVVSEKILSHELAGILKVYDIHPYLDERRAALELWSSEVSKIMEGEK